MGVTSNRNGIGARVEVTVAGGAKLWQLVKTGSSYASQSELPLTFGLGNATMVDAVRIAWPGGAIQTVTNLKANQFVTIKENNTSIQATPITRRP